MIKIQEINWNTDNKIKIAVFAIYGSAMLGLISLILTKNIKYLSIMLLREPNDIYIGIFVNVLIWANGYMINLYKNWARIIFIIFVILGSLGIPFIIPHTFSISPLIGSISIVQTILQISALIILIQKDVHLKFKGSSLNSN